MTLVLQFKEERRKLEIPLTETRQGVKLFKEIASWFDEDLGVMDSARFDCLKEMADELNAMCEKQFDISEDEMLHLLSHTKQHVAMTVLMGDKTWENFYAFFAWRIMQRLVKIAGCLRDLRELHSQSEIVLYSLQEYVKEAVHCRRTIQLAKVEPKLHWGDRTNRILEKDEEIIKDFGQKISWEDYPMIPRVFEILEKLREKVTSV